MPALDFDRIGTRGSYLSNDERLSGVDGLIGSDRFLWPETAQLAWVHQPLRFFYADGVLSVHNERSFASTAGSRLPWKVVEGTKELAQGRHALDVVPEATTAARVPAPASPGDMERFPVGGTVVPAGKPPDGQGRVLLEDAERVEVSGPGFRYAFSKATGTLDSMRVRDVELLASGPELDARRSATRSTRGGRLKGSCGGRTRPAAVESVTASRDPSGGAVVEVRGSVVAPDRPDASFDQVMTYRIDAAGTIRLAHQVGPRGAVRTLPYLPRIGCRQRCRRLSSTSPGMAAVRRRAMTTARTALRSASTGPLWTTTIGRRTTATIPTPRGAAHRRAVCSSPARTT